MPFDVNQLVDQIIRDRSKSISSAIADLVEQGSQPEDITIEYNAFTQIHIVRDTVKGSSKVIQPPEFIW